MDAASHSLGCGVRAEPPPPPHHRKCAMLDVATLLISAVLFAAGPVSLSTVCKPRSPKPKEAAPPPFSSSSGVLGAGLCELDRLLQELNATQFNITGMDGDGAGAGATGWEVCLGDVFLQGPLRQKGTTAS